MAAIIASGTTDAASADIVVSVIARGVSGDWTGSIDNVSVKASII